MKTFKQFINEASKILNLPINKIIPREKVDHDSDRAIDTISHFRGKIRRNESIKPIKVKKYKGNYVIDDGHHRFEAHKQENKKTIRVTTEEKKN